MVDYQTTGMKFTREWDFDGRIRLLSITDLDQAGNPTSDFGEALVAVLTGLGITVGAPTLETLGGSPVVKIGKTGGGTSLGVSDSAVVNLDAGGGEQGLIYGHPDGGVIIAADDTVGDPLIAIVVNRGAWSSWTEAVFIDDQVFTNGLLGTETARVSASTGEISSPTITQLADAITALGSQTFVRDENEPHVSTGDIQPIFAVDGDVWHRSEPE
jgi:hypothetical protein